MLPPMLTETLLDRLSSPKHYMPSSAPMELKHKLDRVACNMHLRNHTFSVKFEVFTAAIVKTTDCDTMQYG
jgi:hypothetical protein